MKALGMIETMGMVGAIEALDAALKTADVNILNRHIIRGGIVTVEIIGDVGAIKVAVEAGAEAAKRLGVLISSHVIARPDEMVFQMLEKNTDISKNEEKIVEEIEEIVEEKLEIDVQNNIKETIEIVEKIELETEIETEKKKKTKKIKK